MREPQWKTAIRQILASRFDGNMKLMSVRAGLNETYVRDVLKRERKKRPGVDNLEALARAANVPLSVFIPEGPSEHLVPVVGHVQAGFEAVFTATGQGPFDWIPSPAGASPQTVAVSVKGNSMAGMFDDGAILYYDDRRDPPTPDLIGRLCILGLEDGRVLVKKLYRGSRRGLWTLISTNENPIEDQRVEWAAAVIFIKP
jgi:phage repressor protein C with HTH and peptisase S24 domain